VTLDWSACPRLSLFSVATSSRESSPGRRTSHFGSGLLDAKLHSARISRCRWMAIRRQIGARTAVSKRCRPNFRDLCNGRDLCPELRVPGLVTTVQALFRHRLNGPVGPTQEQAGTPGSAKRSAQSQRPLCPWIEIDNLRPGSSRDLRSQVRLVRCFVARVAALQRELVCCDKAFVIF
jgi:hypothetical protein